jgi:3-phenylpropionate/trans-cinnamate dioxygenase ferredoxin component
MTLHPLCRAEDIPSDEGRAFTVEGVRLALFRLDDGVYAIDEICTHGDGSLADGYIEGCEVECPLHAGRFDIRTGCPMAEPASIPVASYPVEVIDGIVHVRLEPRALVQPT